MSSADTPRRPGRRPGSRCFRALLSEMRSDYDDEPPPIPRTRSDILRAARQARAEKRARASGQADPASTRAEAPGSTRAESESAELPRKASSDDPLVASERKVFEDFLRSSCLVSNSARAELCGVSDTFVKKVTAS